MLPCSYNSDCDLWMPVTQLLLRPVSAKSLTTIRLILQATHVNVCLFFCAFLAAFPPPPPPSSSMQGAGSSRHRANSGKVMRRNKHEKKEKGCDSPRCLCCQQTLLPCARALPQYCLDPKKSLKTGERALAVASLEGKKALSINHAKLPVDPLYM